MLFRSPDGENFCLVCLVSLAGPLQRCVHDLSLFTACCRTLWDLYLVQFLNSLSLPLLSCIGVCVCVGPVLEVCICTHGPADSVMVQVENSPGEREGVCGCMCVRVEEMRGAFSYFSLLPFSSPWELQHTANVMSIRAFKAPTHDSYPALQTGTHTHTLHSHTGNLHDNATGIVPSPPRPESPGVHSNKSKLYLENTVTRIL